MAGRLKHAQRSRRSYRRDRAMLYERARSNAIRVQTHEIRKSKGAALAKLVLAAKDLIKHKATKRKETK